MSLPEFNKELSDALRKYIKKRKHILTGALYKSVLFDCTFNNTLTLKFSSMYYIKFLEHGDFVNDFYELKSTNEIISQFIISQFEEDLE
jgi:hypothetical protein